MLQNYPDTYRHPLPNGLYYDMVRVRPGVFVMGSEGEEASEKEKPEHLVRITQDYYIGVYPVTQAVWKAVMDGHNPSRFQGDDRPVEQVSWQDIVEGGQDDNVPEAFLDRLNQKFASEIPSYQFRLPTEAEWEYAAKGGHETALSPEELQSLLKTNQPKATELYTAYAGSDQLKEVGWYSQNSHRETKAVGKRQPNELGLYEMNGNVSEWCQDWFSDSYYLYCSRNGITKNPSGFYPENSKSLRGGWWWIDAKFCSLASRRSGETIYRHLSVGFRLILALVP